MVQQQRRFVSAIIVHDHTRARVKALLEERFLYMRKDKFSSAYPVQVKN